MSLPIQELHVTLPALEAFHKHIPGIVVLIEGETRVIALVQHVVCSFKNLLRLLHSAVSSQHCCAEPGM